MYIFHCEAFIDQRTIWWPRASLRIQLLIDNFGLADIFDFNVLFLVKSISVHKTEQA